MLPMSAIVSPYKDQIKRLQQLLRLPSILTPILADESVLKNMQSVALPALADELLDLDVCNLAVEIDQLGGLKLEPLNVV
jgi:hypothetical protein